MRSAIARLHSLVLQRSFQQQQQATRIGCSLPQLSDLQQLAAAALHGNNSSSSSCCCWGSPQAACASVRHMAGRTHKLSLKKSNNRASWMAVAPFLQQQEQQPGSDQMQLQRQVIQSALPPLPVLKEPVLYQKIGTIAGPYSVGAQVGPGRCHEGSQLLSACSRACCAIVVTTLHRHHLQVMLLVDSQSQQPVAGSLQAAAGAVALAIPTQQPSAPCEQATH